MDILEQCLDLELKFEEDNLSILAFFNDRVNDDSVPKVMELYEYSLQQYLDSMEMVLERLEAAKTTQQRLRILTDRDMYLSHVIASYGIKDSDDDKENKKVNK